MTNDERRAERPALKRTWPGFFVIRHSGFVILSSGTLTYVVDGKERPMSISAWSPDGKRFAVADDVQQAMSAQADRLGIVSTERITDELTKLMVASDPAYGLDLLVIDYM